MFYVPISICIDCPENEINHYYYYYPTTTTNIPPTPLLPHCTYEHFTNAFDSKEQLMFHQQCLLMHNNNKCSGNITAYRQLITLQQQQQRTYTAVVRVVVAVAPECTDDMLLHFPFDDHFNDVTCNHAVTTKYGPGQVRLVWDSDRNSTVASFDGRARLEVRYTQTNKQWVCACMYIRDYIYI